MASLVGPAVRLCQGYKWFEGASLGYGILFPTFFAIGQRMTGANFTVGTLLVVIRVLQMSYILIIAFSYWLWYRRKNPKIAVFATILFGCWASNEFNVFFPNHDAWRLFGLAIMPLTLLTFKKLPCLRLSLILGLLSGVCCLINLDTGICITFGLLTFLALRFKKPFTVFNIQSILLFFTGFIVTFGIFIATLGLGLGDWEFIDRFKFANLLKYSVLNALKFGGQIFSADPAPWLIFWHSVYIFFSSIVNYHSGENGFVNAFKGSISITIIAWFSYYANRSSPEYLATYILLYGFLIGDYVHTFIQQTNSYTIQHDKIKKFVFIAIFLISLGPSAIAAAKTSLRNMENQLELSGRAHVTVSKVGMPLEIGHEIEKKASFLRSFSAAQTKPLVYFTILPFFFPIHTGVANGLPAIDPFGLTLAEDVKNIFKYIKKEKPDSILLEEPNGYLYQLPSSVHQLAFNRMVVMELAEIGYTKVKIKSGWEVWEFPKNSTNLSALR